jgi:ADP-L-glycero-D-manno-heptose 6-epimerase
MIVVTGAAGFISSVLVEKLNQEGFFDLVLVDDFSREDKKRNFENKKFRCLVDRVDFESWLDENENEVQFIFHLGARTDTAEFNRDLFNKLNLNYSKMIWNKCVEYGLSLVYASSAATYGLGEQGYSDSHELIEKLAPLNPYGDSKNDFDKWVLGQERRPYFWAGLKFFNVYGPNEYHKGRMASVVLHAFNQISETSEMKLFGSHKEGVEDGHQSRDFVYVKDVADVCFYLMNNRKDSGIYNLGSGESRTFLDLVKNTFKSMDMESKISFIDTPEDIRNTYQYFTEAKIEKLMKIGYDQKFTSLEEGVKDYVRNYLMENKSY